MIRKIGELTTKQSAILHKKLPVLMRLLKKDVSNYAPNRLRTWLFNEGSLYSKEIWPAYFDEELWELCQEIYIGCEVGLFIYGGDYGSNYYSNSCIKWHRDASYAQADAVLINILGEAEFGYDLERQKGEEITISMTDKEIYRFNCKHRHCVLNHSNPRASLILWKLTI